MIAFPKSRRVVLGAVAAAALVALVTGRPAYRAVKTWRAAGHLASAEQQDAQGKWHDAYASLRAANSLAPENARITRGIARLLGAHGDPQALAFLEMLGASPDGTAQDRIDFIRLALRIGQLTEVQRHLLALLRDPQAAHRCDVLLLAAEWHGRSGDRSHAIGFAREALARTHDAAQSAEAKLLLARLLLQPSPQIAAAPDAMQRAEAKIFLREIASREDRAGLDALLIFAEVCNADASPEQARQISEGLRNHPLAGDAQRLLGLTWKLRCDPEHREEILADAIATFRESGAAHLAAVTRWLIQQQEPRRALSLIPLAGARENQELFLIYVDALADIGRWQDLQILLAGKAPLPIDPTIRRVYEVRAALGLGRENEAREHWSAVRKSMPGADPKSIFYVAQYAERLGMREDAAKAYRQLTGIEGAERAGYLGLILLTEKSGDTRKLRDQMKEFAGRFPGEFEPQNDLAYLDLLLNENVASSLERAAQRVKRFPDVLAYRTTLALAHLRSGDASAARKVYGEMGTDWNSAKPGWRAVYAAVLAASGERAAASTHAGEIEIARLKPEERALIAGLGSLSSR